MVSAAFFMEKGFRDKGFLQPFFILERSGPMEEKKQAIERQLAELRARIDVIDADILGLINQRLGIGKEIGRIKDQQGTGVLDQGREKRLLQRLARINDGPATEDLVRYLFNVIMTATREIQKANRISFLGPVGSYTHIAALNLFSHSGKFIEQGSIRDIFLEIEKKNSHYGVVPVENSIEGAVNHTLDLFSEFDVYITAEHYERISHDLLSLSGDMSAIKTIYSHPQALAQCRGWLRKKMPGIETVEVSSTSRAAALVAENPLAAAISSRRAAHIYGLKVVASRIEDHVSNITRFLSIGREKKAPTGNDKTSIMFATSHVPGALFMALEPVKLAGLNMVKLESRPTRHQNWSYYFFMDVEGHIQEKRVADTLSRMKPHCLYLKELGSYPAGKPAVEDIQR